MSFDRTGGGHAFDFDRDVCVKCGMTRSNYLDNRNPSCTGRPREEERREPMMIDEWPEPDDDNGIVPPKKSG
ncbi:MAG: hypothetical protein WBX25_15120 [Rhodomicrobium sp.]